MDQLLLKLLNIYKLNEIEVFHPYNNLKLVWDIIHFMIIMVLLFTIPIDICFFQNLEQDVEGFLAFYFSTDILINMNTSYFNKGFIVKERKVILRHYLTTEFLPDILTAIYCLLDLRNYGHYRLFKMIFFLRWRKLEKISLRVQEKFKIGLKLHSSFMDLINLIFFSFYILHVFACFWYYIGVVNEEFEKNTWIIANNLQYESLTTKYFYSFYWSSVTIMTVGYGDITAHTEAEITYSILTIVIGCGVFAYIINTIGIIIGDITNENQLFK